LAVALPPPKTNFCCGHEVPTLCETTASRLQDFKHGMAQNNYAQQIEQYTPPV